jgi:signal transduction histidine kinase
MGIVGKGMSEGESLVVGGGSRPGESEEKPFDWVPALIEKDRLTHTARLIRGLIHNINGPLHNLSMLVEMLMYGQDQVDKILSAEEIRLGEVYDSLRSKQRDRLQRVMQQISSLSEMLQDFSAVHEMTGGAADVDIAFVLNKLTKAFRADLFFKHRVDVNLQLEENLPPVNIPGRDLIPSLMHLIRNALLALADAPDKKLTIECSRKDRVIRVAIRDSGIGFDPQRAEDFYHLFYSGWPKETLEKDDIERHFGFGLYVVRSLLQPYGVRMSLTRQGAETVALLEIPLQ